MLLPLFNLTAVIENYNQIYEATYPANEDFGFKFLNAQLLNDIQATLTYIEKGVESTYFTKDEKAYLVTRKQLLQETREHFKTKSVKKPLSLIVDIDLEKSVNKKFNYLQWLDDHFDQLNNHDNWDNWLQIAPAIADLKEIWEAQCAFGRHTHQALVEASELIAVLIAHYQHAAAALQKIYNRFLIPRYIYKAYKAHVKEFLSLAQEVQQQIAHSMLIRLQAWDAKQPNLIAHLYTQIKQSGAEITYNPAPLSVAVDPLTNTHLITYQNYIWQTGSPKTKEQMQQLSWFKTSSVLSTEGQMDSQSIQLIPTNLRKDIPRNQRKPAWLFKGSNIRYEFFKDKMALLIYLKQSPAVSTVGLDLQKPSQIQDLLTAIHSQEALVDNALKELTKSTYTSLHSLFQNHTRQFLAKWHALLVQHQEQQLENKVILAERIYEAISKQYQDTFDIVNNAWEACNQLNKLLEALKQDSLNNTLRLRVENIQQQFNQLFKTNRVIYALHQLASDEPLSAGERHFLHQYLRYLFVRNRHQYEAILENYTLQRRTITDNFAQALKNFFNSAEPYEAAEHLEGLAVVASLTQTSAQRQAYENKIKKFFLNYLATILENLAENNDVVQDHYLPAAGTLLKTLGEKIYYGSETLTTCITQLQSVARQPDLLKAKCLAFITDIAEQYLLKQWEKDAQQLQANIDQYILSLPLRYEPVHLALLAQIRDRAVQTHQSLEALPLSVPEQKLAGLIAGETAIIKPLLEASIQTQQMNNVMLDKEVTLAQKYRYLRSLHLNLHLRFAHTEAAEKLSKTILQSRSKRYSLFSKTVIDPTVLPTQTCESARPQLTYT